MTVLGAGLLFSVTYDLRYIEYPCDGSRSPGIGIHTKDASEGKPVINNGKVGW